MKIEYAEGGFIRSIYVPEGIKDRTEDTILLHIKPGTYVEREATLGLRPDEAMAIISVLSESVLRSYGAIEEESE